MTNRAISWVLLVTLCITGWLGAADRLAADETRVNTYTTNNQRDPSVAMDDDGDFVVTWESYGQSNPNNPNIAMYDVYAQRFDSSGNPAGPEFPVYASSYDQRNPAAAMDGDGNFVIAFEHDKNGQGDVGIWGWRYNSNGSFAGNMIIASEYPAKQYPSIAMADGSGNFTVTWDGLDDSSYGIYGRRYRGDGVLYVDTFQVNTTETSVQTKSSVGMDNYSNLLVAWESHGGQDGDGIGVFAQMYAYADTKSGVEFQVNTTTEGNQTNPSAAMSWGGRGVVVWESSSSNGNLNTYDIYAQLIKLNGTLEGEEFRVNTTTEGYQGRPSVSWDAGNGFVVAWSSQGQDGSHSGIYARQFDFNGVPLSGEFLVNTTTEGSQSSAAVAANLQNPSSFVAAWQGPDEDGDGVFMSWPLEVPKPQFFADGFESGDTSAWSSTVQ